MLDAVRSTYEQTKVKFTWQKNDLLLLDNTLLRTVESRIPVRGKRWRAWPVQTDERVSVEKPHFAQHTTELLKSLWFFEPASQAKAPG